MILRLYHTDTSSTLSMLPREKGGAVDSSLKVYGTKNVRVADLSVVPLQVGVHTQCMLTKLFVARERILTKL